MGGDRGTAGAQSGVRVGVELLSRAWELSADRLERRCAGLTDAELRWEPVPGSWNLVAAPDHPGGWDYPYEDDPPEPHPVTTIGWRLVHLAADNWIYSEHAFGPGVRSFPDLPVHGTAAEVLADWRASREPVTAWLAAADDDDLGELRPSHLGEPVAAGEVVRILVDEQVHHGAEIALLRDLHLRRARRAHGGAGLRPTGLTPNLHVADTSGARAFYQDYLGLSVVGFDLGWVVNLQTPDGRAVVQLVSGDATSPVDSVISVHVGDEVEAAYAEAQRRGYEVVHPLTQEPWGVRRFLVRAPDGTVVNVVSHDDDA